MKEPISHFFEKDGFNPSIVRRYALGERFAGIMLNDGRIGICAVLDAQLDDSILSGRKQPDISNHGHRVVLNAYYNALYNYSTELPCNSDILNRVNLRNFRNIVIVGYFESMVRKLRDAGISFRVFDKDENIEDEGISPVTELPDALGKADAVIITGSSIANNTFCDLTGKTGSGCSVFLLGPSNILHPDMFNYKNVKVIFGSVFERYEERILDMIDAGHGAKDFLTDKNKVCMNHHSFKLL
ncbi:MAG TPA: DUF364 domain-containing protein [Bacteroidales bacterium]|nr:DUF364 domain-containing protein [Bacteroidales bacterium]